MAEAFRAGGERRNLSTAHLVMIFTLILQLAGIVWGAATLNTKVDYGIDQITKVEKKVDELSKDVTQVSLDVAGLKADVSNLKTGRK